MWDMRRRLDPRPLPPNRCTIHFLYPELRSVCQNWWLIVNGTEVNLCSTDPGYEIDLMVTASLRCMTSVWMGVTSVPVEIAAGRMQVDGDPRIGQAMAEWLGLSPFALEKRRVP